MTSGTINGESEDRVIGIDRLFEVQHMTRGTFCGRTRISTGMTLEAICTGMGSGEGERGHTVIEDIICTACRMTGQARGAVVGITGNAIVIIVGFRIHVAGDAGEFRIVCRIGMAIDTGAPFAIVLAAENGEVLPVVIEGGRDPAGFTMTGSAVLRKHQGSVIRIGSLVIVRLVASGTGAWCIEVIPVMTGCTVIGDQGMGAIQGVEVIVIGEQGRVPVGICGMAGGTIHGESKVVVIRIARLVEILSMAGGALGWCASISCGMTGSAVDSQMAAGEREGGQTVIKDILCIAGRMAGQTSRTGIDVAQYAAMGIIRFGIHVAGRTRKLGVVCRIGMAVGTGGPFPLMLSGIDGEIRGIMVLEGGRHPTRICGMAGCAIG